MLSNIIIEMPAYPIDLMYKYFSITYHEPLTYYYNTSKPTDYLYLEAEQDDLTDLINYLDIETYATVGMSKDDTQHLYLYNTITAELEYSGLLVSNTKEFCEAKKAKYIHFKYIDFYATFNFNSVQQSPSKLRH